MESRGKTLLIAADHFRRLLTVLALREPLLLASHRSISNVGRSPQLAQQEAQEARARKATARAPRESQGQR